MKSVNWHLNNPQWIRQEIKMLNEYIDKFNAELKEYRLRRTLEIVKEVLNDKV